MNRTALALALLLIACSTRAPRRATTRPTLPNGDRTVRVALVAPDPRVSATSGFGWYESNGRTLVTPGRRGDQWRLERERNGSRVRALRPDGVATVWQRVLVARANEDGFVTVNGKRYRGDIQVIAQDTTLLVVNRLGAEDYLRGVVPVEMGKRPSQDSAALQAQAVASRSYVYLRAADRAGRLVDVRASTADQAYGGMDVENDDASAAIDGTRGLVLRYRGRSVDAPYSSTCGGTTAEAPEIWRTPGAPHLQRVSDRVGLSDRYYCDIAPRYRWTRTLSSAQLNAALEQYLKVYTSVPGGRPGDARGITVRSRTPSGRVGTMDVETNRGTFPVRGDDIRSVLRPPGGEILSSTYFSVEPDYGRDGLITRITIRGQGDGHGVGMCQWGAIGRARSGHSFIQILGTYYPGTTVGPVQ